MLSEQELKEVTRARLEFEDEIDCKLSSLRDCEIFTAGYKAGKQPKVYFTFHSYTLRWERKLNQIWTYPTIEGVF